MKRKFSPHQVGLGLELAKEGAKEVEPKTAEYELLIQPGGGVKPFVAAIDDAKERVEIAIFRFDRSEIEKALVRAVKRGVFVHALIAYTNRGGEKNLRQLEMRLLDKGITVARTAGDLVRYHCKYMIIDRRKLYLLAFNFTYLDMEHSRSFGLITRNEKFVEEAARLFDADTKRQTYKAGFDQFVVSPVNAREQLTAFIESAKKELLIYDPKVADPAFIRLLAEKSRAGVDIRIIGKLMRKCQLQARDLAQIRLHTRTIVRDGEWVFIGSQSLRASELQTRREAGMILESTKIAESIVKLFEEDWAVAREAEQKRAGPSEHAARAAKNMAKALTGALSAVSRFWRLSSGK